MKMPVYKPEGNKLVRIFWLKNELFQSRGIWTCSKCPSIKYVGFNPGVILRGFYKIDVIFFRKCGFSKIAVKSPSSENQKSCCFSDLVHHAGHKY